MPHKRPLYFSARIVPLVFSLLAAAPGARAATFTVTNSAAFGTGSLPDAVAKANSNAGPDVIAFNLAAPYRIILTNQLPPFTNAVLVDGATQSGFTGSPVVKITANTNTFAGFLLSATAASIQSLHLAGFGTAVYIDSRSNEVRGCWIFSNANSGVLVVNPASDTLIGGTAASNRNVISANFFGIGMSSTSGVTTVQGNYIGTDPSGTVGWTNFIGISLQSPRHQIGGNSSSARNIISSSGNQGIYISGSQAFGNTIAGNYIGTSVTGSNALPNGIGIQIIHAGNSNVVGGITPSHGNLLAGNINEAISLSGSNGSLTLIRNNTIGLNPSGTALPNGTGGFGQSALYLGTSSNTVFQNVISGNRKGAITISYPGEGNSVVGNLIGVDPGGTSPRTNTGLGIRLELTHGNVIGSSSSPLFRNIISANTLGGISIAGGGGNTIENNFIGTDLAGTNSLDNAPGGIGVQIQNTSSNRIGTVGGGNLISANTTAGIYIFGASSTVTYIDGNLIGTDVSGTNGLSGQGSGIQLGDAGRTYIGTSNRNVICANTDYGILVGSGSTNIVIAQNYIGVGTNGSTRVPNGVGVLLSGLRLTGILVTNNVISGNASDGLSMNSLLTATNILIAGNIVGLNAAGTGISSNGRHGLNLQACGQVQVGGTNATMANHIAGNGGDGVRVEGSGSTGHVVIAGNNIGMAPGGVTMFGNGGSGVQLFNSTAVQIGGPVFATRNIFGGNSNGVFITGGSSNCWIASNFIGLESAGFGVRSNRANGIQIDSSCHSNLIENNYITGSGGSGIRILGSRYTEIRGNRIGVGVAVLSAMGNKDAGILGDTVAYTTIGGEAAGTGNRIAFNGGAGIAITNVPGDGADRKVNLFLGNLIYSNGGPGIDLHYDGPTPNDGPHDPDTFRANELQNYPEVQFASYGGTNISGKFSGSNTTLRFEFFALSPSVGMSFLGATNHYNPTNGASAFTYVFAPGLPTNASIVATATSEDGTSELCPAIPVNGTLGVTDTDGDGMPDWWELAHGLNAGVSNAPNDDYDDDGYVDFSEWVADTLPGDIGSHLSIVVVTNGATRYVYAPSSAGRLYSLRYTDPITSPTWTAISSNVPGTGVLLGLSDNTPATTNRFYQFGARLP